VRIWIDGDSVPRDLRQMLIRRGRPAGSRTDHDEVIFVATRGLPDVPPGMTVLVAPGPDAADLHVEALVREGDLVVTRDIPFAERIASRGIAVMNDRGEVFTRENAAERRSLRDAAAELRSLGMAPASPRGSRRGPRYTKSFADSLDRIIASMKSGKHI